jgi:diguanylate cyclase (GGDEF)-like protein
MKIWLFGDAIQTQPWTIVLSNAEYVITQQKWQVSLPQGHPDMVLVCHKDIKEAANLCSLLRQQEQFQDQPLIVLLTEDQTGGIDLPYQKGADDVVLPKERPSLPSRMERHLRRYRRLKELLHQLAEAQEQRRHLEWHDRLTGLGNRQYIQQFIQKDQEVTLRAYRNWERSPTDQNPADDDIAFIFVEVDHFRFLNDQYGQDFGDQVLIKIRDCLQEVFRETDTLIRWGGKTFLVVSRKANRDSAGRLAERARSAIHQCTMEPDDKTSLQLSASIGICFFPFLQSTPDRFSWEDVVGVSRLARDSAKASGKNAWVAINAASLHESNLSYDAVMRNPMRCITSGAIQVSTSFPDYHTLTWPTRHD